MLAATYIRKIGPYLHDGSVTTLPDMGKKMAEHQLGKVITDDQTQSIVAFLQALKGDLPQSYIEPPPLPPSTDATPKADPS